jgi:hypothetical protein
MTDPAEDGDDLMAGLIDLLEPLTDAQLRQLAEVTREALASWPRRSTP